MQIRVRGKKLALFRVKWDKTLKKNRTHPVGSMDSFLLEIPVELAAELDAGELVQLQEYIQDRAKAQEAESLVFMVKYAPKDLLRLAEAVAEVGCSAEHASAILEALKIVGKAVRRVTPKALRE